MKDTHRAVRRAYYARLFGNILFNGEVVNVYDGETPFDVKYPYITFSEQTSEDNTERKNFIETTNTLLLEIVTKQGSGMQQADEIAEQLIPLLGELDMSPDFDVKRTTILSNGQINSLNDDGTMGKIRIVTVQNIINQN